MTYDLAIIGAGWAGFNAALAAKEAGLKVALIENSQIGGTCLNRGCIPTKSLIQSAKIFPQDLAQMQSRKEKIIQDLRAGMEFRLKGIEIIRQEAKIIFPNSIKAGEEEIMAKHILIATGSSVVELSNFKFDGKKIVSSDQMLGLKIIPKSLLIIGAGVIGCEFANLFSGLGAQVTLFEKMPQILPGVDKEVAKKLETSFKKRGIKINTNSEASTSDLNNFELVLVCVGRKPNTANLGLEQVGVKTEKRKILVDEFLRTSIPNIFAAGDCTGKIMLAHYASYQGVIAAQNVAYPQKARKADNQVIPNCIFTKPQIGCVGLDEEQAKSAGFEVKVKKFDFLGSSMARIIDETEGFIKVIIDLESDRVLGASIIGPQAAELIAIFGLAISNSLLASQIKETIFAHPTLSECLHEVL